MTDKLDRLAESFWVPDQLRTRLQDQGITKPGDLGIVTAGDASVEEKHVQASGVVDFPNFSDEVAVTELWMHCRVRADRHAGVRCEQEWDEDKLDDMVPHDISVLWTARHEIKWGVKKFWL